MRIYVSSPYRGDVETNIKNARDYCKFVVNSGNVPVAPHLFYTQFLDDNIPSERLLGMKLALDDLDLCDELWVFGKISDGMQKEINHFSSIGIIKYIDI